MGAFKSRDSFAWDVGQQVKIDPAYYDSRAKELRFLNVAKDCVYAIEEVHEHDGQFEYSITAAHRKVKFDAANLVLLPNQKPAYKPKEGEPPFWVRGKFIKGRTITGAIRGHQYCLNAKTSQVYIAAGADWQLMSEQDLASRPYIKTTLLREYQYMVDSEKQHELYLQRQDRREYARAMSVAATSGQSVLMHIGISTRN